ncbi:uncharacterized protein MELLADRAFT_91299 [Melampsora larici-populina 98AG31]|uniref:Uncharacterized protein n=1 Tax=Melampsora larici-populina (strain 98AG31 / pathotype 3-4-7) TaxID=747676 RepID=F4RYJ1_MELLP|nr:uncharacterized protein MELLADRAFT_91299 [Melampsora larici-populina 98AG31]EGG02569.1 hypothetical protein MELLADRAFT_91299 [Melampsora larici-populina 98AG31]
MSYAQVQSYVFLPKYILDYVVGDDKPRIDPDLFITKANPSQIVEVIVAFYPHLQLTENACHDHELLLKIFIEMVAPCLSNLVSSFDREKNYVQALFEAPIYTPSQSTRWVNSAADIDTKRIGDFEAYVLQNFKNGNYRLAAKQSNLQFLRKYKFLKKEEIEEIMHVETEANEALHEILHLVQDSHELIESIQLRLHQPKLSQIECEDFEEHLRSANTSLKSRQVMFNTAVQNVGFINAFIKHHKDILVKHQLNPST